METQTETQQPQEDAFAAAFGEATQDAPVPATPATEPAAPVVADATTDAPAATDVPAATDAPAATDVPAATDAPAATDVPATTAPAPAVTQPADQNLDPRFIAQAMLEAQQQAEQTRQQQAEQTRQQQAQDRSYTAVDFLTDEDKASIAKLKTEWPEEYPAFERMCVAHSSAAVTNAHNQLVKQLNTILAPLVAKMQHVEVNSHQAAILAAHSDYTQVLPGVREWVSKQPAYLRPTLEGVLEKGSSQDMIDLVASYKQAIGSTGAAPATPASSAVQEQQPAAPVKAPVNPAAVAATAAVPASQRTTQSKQADPTDFGNAFAEAAALLTAAS